MGFLKLGKKKAAAAAQAAEAPAETSIKAPIILVEDVSADDGTIDRQDSTASKKSLEPDGIKTNESRDPEEIQPVASDGSKPDAPASRNLASSSEPRDPDGTAPPHQIITISQPEAELDDSPMSPPETPTAASPKNRATDFLDAIGKTLSNVCMLGGGARPMDEEFEDDDDDSSRASGGTTSTLGQESVRTTEEPPKVDDVAEEVPVASETKNLAPIEEDEGAEVTKAASGDLPSLVDKEFAAEEDKQTVVEEATDGTTGNEDAPTESPAGEPKSKKSLFGWCAGCRSAKSTTAAVIGTAAAVGIGAAAVAAATADEEPVVATATNEEPSQSNDEASQAKATEEEKALDLSPEDGEEMAEAEEEDAAAIPAVQSALSDQGSKRSKRSRNLLSAAMSRFSRKNAVPDEVSLNNDVNNLEEIPGMVRFMSHTERIERGFEVLLRDFSGFMRQCGQCEIKNYDEYDTTTANEITADEIEEKAVATEESEAKLEEQEAVAATAEVTSEREDSEERQQDDEEAEGRDDEQPEPVEKEADADIPTVASKQSKSSRFSLRSILGKKSNSILAADQSSKVPEELNQVDAVPSKALSNLSRASADGSDEMGPQEAYLADVESPPLVAAE